MMREKRESGRDVFAESAPRTAKNESRTGAMLVNGEPFPAQYWPHAEWTEPLPQKLSYGWRRPCPSNIDSRQPLPCLISPQDLEAQPELAVCASALN